MPNEVPNKEIKEVAFGAAFSPRFQLLDLWGEIADRILYDNKYFSTDMFPKISSNYTIERRLYNPQNNNCFVLTSNNLVYVQPIEKDFIGEFNKFKKRVSEYIVPEILSKHSLVIRRLGVVYTCAWSDAEIQKFAGKFFLPTISNISDFRFSQKMGTVKGTLFSENSDFINKIYTVGNVSEEIKGVMYDYQQHYHPLRSDVRSEIGKVLSKSYDSFQEDVTT
ncbi:hypothetical protein [Acutalibacter sp. JLR.KK004]|uniref:hypothetical protein n=1 Tax=Acutalibacter sp. JLR.KK004 TaxID=3112622 RepID=UPI002FF138BA